MRCSRCRGLALGSWTSQTLRASAALAAVAARKPEIVVDLGGLEFIDSSGVAALARGRKHARRRR
jgi:anti-anti-sigma factor